MASCAPRDLVPPDSKLDPEFVAAVKRIFEEKITFNRLLGLQVVSVTTSTAEGCIDMRPELVGHYELNRLHGGVISGCLDAIGGLAVMAALAARHHKESLTQRLAHFGRLGLIDLRTDYLRPGIGRHFSMRAQVMRIGSRVASTRMEFLGANGTLLSLGTGVYIVS
jgi:uncharacterized protein (TIGR00369 family)